LNLSRATLCAILKYPWLRNTAGEKSNTKWGAYYSESGEFVFARAIVPTERAEARSLEAELMDWADDVAYAVHDVEDFFRAGIVPLDRLASNKEEQEAFIEAAIERDVKLKKHKVDDLNWAFSQIIGSAPIFDPYTGSRQSRALLRTFTSSLIDRYISAASLATGSDGCVSLQVDEKSRMVVNLLKGITWHYVIESRPLIAHRYGQKNLIKSLFLILCDAGSTSNDRRIFPEFFRELLGESPTDHVITRTVADLISSMTESQVVEMHHRLTGISLGAALDPIVQ
jgi:dGTPase